MTLQLGPASYEIKKALKIITDRPLEPVLQLPVLERKASLTPNQIRLLNAIEQGGKCSRGALMDWFPEFKDEELYYRLEMLRLLSLVSVDLTNAETDPKQAIYRLHPSYQEAIRLLGGGMRIQSAAAAYTNHPADP